MFSWTYLGRSAKIALKHPSILIGWLQGKDVGAELHSKRNRAWARIGEAYKETPKNVQGFKIYLNPEDTTPVSTSKGTDGILDLPLTCLILKKLKRGMTLVDVGANVGYFTFLGSKIVGDKGRVYAFEPESLNFRLLSKSLDSNKLGNVEIRKLAVSDRSGRAKLFKAGTDQPGGHSIGTDRGLGSEDVPTTTLDDFWEDRGRPHWDMLKIHVVGDDSLVLRGGIGFLEKVRPMVAMVYDQPKWSQDGNLQDKLFEMYSVYEIIESPFLLRRIKSASLIGDRPRPLFLKSGYG